MIAAAVNINCEIIDCSFLHTAVPLIDIAITKCNFDNLSLHVCAIYIPPDVSLEIFDTFLSSLEQLIFHKTALIVGDFNIPNFNNDDNKRGKSSSLHCFCNFLGLKQSNFVFNTNNRQLDLVLINKDIITEVRHTDSSFVYQDTHHPALDITVGLKKNSCSQLSLCQKCLLQLSKS